MDKQSMDPHVQAGLYGTPQVNPDEQNHYLGNFRERVYAIQTREHIGEPRYMQAWERQMAKYPDATLYLNGHLDRAILDKFMKLASHYKMRFTLKTDDVYDRSDIMVVLAAKTAVHQEIVDIVVTTNEQDQSIQEPQSESKTKSPWYKKLF